MESSVYCMFQTKINTHTFYPHILPVKDISGSPNQRQWIYREKKNMNNEYFVILWAEKSLREKRCFQPAPVQSSLPLGQGQSGSCDWESSHWHKSCPLAKHVHEPVQTRLAVAGWVLAMIQAQFPSIKFCCTFLKIKFCLKEMLGLRRKASCALEDDQSLGHSYHSCAKSHTFSLTKRGKIDLTKS